jgi:hypothetical protein
MLGPCLGHAWAAGAWAPGCPMTLCTGIFLVDSARALRGREAAPEDRVAYVSIGNDCAMIWQLLDDGLDHGWPIDEEAACVLPPHLAVVHSSRMPFPKRCPVGWWWPCLGNHGAILSQCLCQWFMS